MSLSEKKVNATLVLETIGRPAEYLTETLNNIIQTMGKEQGVKIKNSRVNVPVELKQNPGFYSNFAEIDVETENILFLIILIFKYMPAHVEVVSPQELSLSNFDWGDVLSELTRRLHGYEEVVRIAQGEKLILERKLREVLATQQKTNVKPLEDKKEQTKEETTPEKKNKRKEKKKK
jgi:hypothetical protein